MNAKIQALEKFIKTDQRDIQIHTEKFKGAQISACHYKTREKQTKVFQTTKLNSYSHTREPAQRQMFPRLFKHSL